MIHLFGKERDAAIAAIIETTGSTKRTAEAILKRIEREVDAVRSVEASRARIRELASWLGP